MTALMFVGMMAVAVGVLMTMDGGLVAVLMAVVHMGVGPMAVLMLMFVFAVATHTVSPPIQYIFYIITRLLPRSHPDEINGAKIA
jgi:hypothetical protein